MLPLVLPLLLLLQHSSNNQLKPSHERPSQNEQGPPKQIKRLTHKAESLEFGKSLAINDSVEVINSFLETMIEKLRSEENQSNEPQPSTSAQNRTKLSVKAKSSSKTQQQHPMNLNDYEDTPQFGSKPELLSDVNLVDRLHDIPGKILHNVPCIFYVAQKWLH